MVLLVEATAVPGEGRLTITGGCGDEFAKSARIAVQCVIEMFKETK
jgi:ATP-dependent Lon protease